MKYELTQNQIIVRNQILNSNSTKQIKVKQPRFIVNNNITQTWKEPFNLRKKKMNSPSDWREGLWHHC